MRIAVCRADSVADLAVGAIMQPLPRQRRTRPNPARAAIDYAPLVAVVMVFGLEIRQISPINGWSVDELYSVWASDLSHDFIDAFFQRILPDTSPPICYSALFWARRIIADERTATIALNLLALASQLLGRDHRQPPSRRCRRVRGVLARPTSPDGVSTFDLARDGRE